MTLNIEKDIKKEDLEGTILKTRKMYDLVYHSGPRWDTNPSTEIEATYGSRYEAEYNMLLGNREIPEERRGFAQNQCIYTVEEREEIIPPKKERR